MTTRSGFQWPPSGILWPALSEVASAVLGDHRPDLRPVFLEFHRVGDDVLDNQVSRHVTAPMDYGRAPINLRCGGDRGDLITSRFFLSNLFAMLLTRVKPRD